MTPRREHGQAAGPTVVWFRRDLRLKDHPALLAAAAQGAVIPLYVLDETPGVRAIGAAGLWWLDKSLRRLAEALAARGSRLILRRGPAANVVAALAREAGAAAVVWSRLYDPGVTERDAALAAALKADGLSVETFNAAFLTEPGSVRTKTGGEFRVFTPFWRAARPTVRPPSPLPAPDRLQAPAAWPATEDLDAWRLHPTKPDWSTGFEPWTPGEAGAAEKLAVFARGGLAGYQRARDRPAEDGSSSLSPHLHWGEAGPRQVWCAVEHAAAHQHEEAQAEKFYSELGWREFNHQLLAEHPGLGRDNFKRGFDALRWREDPAGLDAWRRGVTGYPIVDAGMRQLWRIGWMHNRVRLIAASFLVKHLLIDWREGERWFWDTLVDADEANNAANWQWIAGSGADASPFFRIFNPVAQGLKFDADGDYIRRWVPELAKLEAPAIHAPWEADAAALAAAGATLGESYPKPVVEHAAARARALAALRAARGAAAPGAEAAA